MRKRFIGLHIDFVGFSASLLCAIHCALLPFLLSLTPLMGLPFLENPWMEYSVIFVSFLIASYAITHGYISHHRKFQPLAMIITGFSLIVVGHALHIGWVEIVSSAIGGSIVAAAHVVNWTFTKKAKNKCTHYHFLHDHSATIKTGTVSNN